MKRWWYASFDDDPVRFEIVGDWDPPDSRDIADEMLGKYDEAARSATLRGKRIARMFVLDDAAEQVDVLRCHSMTPGEARAIWGQLRHDRQGR